MTLDDFAMLRRGQQVPDAVLYLPDGQTLTGAGARPHPASEPSPATRTSPPAARTAVPPSTRRPYLTCPECDRRAQPGRIGSRRSTCATCNRFAASVRADERRLAMELLTDEQRDQNRRTAELAVYARQHPELAPITTAPEEAHR